MRLSSHKIKKENKFELQMTSMIDMVFLLLIFFMTTSSFVKTERELDSAIRVKSKTARAAASNLEPAIIEVVRGGGGSFVYKVGSRELTTQDELEELLSQFSNKMDGAYVRVADEAPFEMAAAAIQAAKTAKFLGVSYVPLSSNP